MYLLDTDVCVWLLRGREPVVSAVRAHSPGDLAIGSMTEAELWFGVRKGRVEANLLATKRFIDEIGTVLPFGSAAAKIHAQVRFALRSTPISDRDLVIASTALASDRTLVTGNLRE
ncbi:MAG TPA: type II toxin-antitoxin system VapC family toxin, partial [Longimicrobiaceae bacterium]|nr:type II toxin-antitoxin system VapC family toxin [Longimicrobiaceae bacterium]